MRLSITLLAFLFTALLNAQCDQPCNFSFKLIDTVGDTWNGNSMTVTQGDTSYLIALDFTTGFFQYTYSLPLCEEQPFQVYWNAGGAYPNEVVLEIKNPEGQVIFFLPAGNRFQDSLIFTSIPSCTAIACPQPSALKFTSISVENPSLTWTNFGGATQWEVLARPSTSAAPSNDTNGNLVSSTSYSTNELLPQIDYSFYVRSVCGTDKSEWAKKDLRCPKPYNLVYVTQSRFYDFYTTWGSEFSSTYEILLQNAADPEPTALTQGLVTTEQQYKTDGLVEGAYAFYLRSRCNDNAISEWHGPMLFNVLCGQPTDVTVLGNQISWTPTGAAAQWEVFISDLPFQPTLTTSGILTDQNPFFADNLTLGQTYYVYVRSNCGNEITSAWSQQIQFEYQGLSLDSQSTLSVSIYPNPTEELLHLQANENLASLAIIDVTGKALLHETLDQATSSVDVSHLQNGFYLATITSKVGNKQTIQFVKK